MSSSDWLTLIAALVAALAAIAAALLASRTSKAVVELSSEAGLRRDLELIARNRVMELSDSLLHNCLKLSELTDFCANQYILANKPLIDIHENGEVAISRIEFSIRQLRQMDALSDAYTHINLGLREDFRRLMVCAANYREHLTPGHDAPRTGETVLAQAAWLDLIGPLNSLSDLNRDLQDVIANSPPQLKYAEA